MADINVVTESDTQQNKLLRIDTVLSAKEKGTAGDPLLLVKIQGNEGISQPFSYDVTMFRDKGKRDIDPDQLINTVARIGIKPASDQDEVPASLYFPRKGVIEHFERASGNVRGFRVYNARIVPAFKLMGLEIRYRIFEHKTPKQIIDEVLTGFPNLKFNTSLLGQDKLPTLEYCVQYGESSFAFLSRLMATYGMWYTFNHEADPQNEVLVIGRRHDAVTNVADSLVEISKSDTKDLDATDVAAFIRGYDAMTRRARVGNFNPLKPTEPIEDDTELRSDYVLSSGDSDRYDRSYFPEPCLTGFEAIDQATRRAKADEVQVYRVTGQSKNRSFVAGRTFLISDDKTLETPQDKDVRTQKIFGDKRPKYLIKYLSFAAIDNTYGQDAGTDIVDFFKDLTKAVGTGSADDITASIANGALNNYLQNEQQVAWLHAFHPGDESHAIPFFPFALAGSLASLASILPNILASIKNVAAQHGITYSNSFVALPWEPPTFALLPPAASPRPIAHGPHLAVVIGDHGVDTPGGQDIHSDALGRVRVRFPWDPGPPDGPDRYKTGNNTCWCRVSEGWAGSRFGTQFLPRIGQEVLVGFIDGDPERPIITGRVYNADAGPTKMPFPSQETASKNLAIKDLLDPTITRNVPRSGIKTRSTPKPDGARDRFHMLRFDDTWQNEQIVLRCQNRYDMTAFGSAYHTTHGNRHILVGGKDPDTGKGGGALFTTTGGEYDLHAGKDRYEGVDSCYQLSVKGNTTFDLQGDHASVVGGNATVNAKNVVIEASQKITLKVGGSFVVVDPCGVFIKGPIVQINSGGSPGSTSDQDITDPADAGMADPGDPPNWLALHPPGAGGARRHHTAHAQHGLVCTANPDGTIQVTKGIKVDAKDTAYADTVISQIALIDSTPTGHNVINGIDNSGKSGLIKPANPPFNPPNAGTTPDDPVAAAKPGSPDAVDGAGHPLPTAGTGSNSTVE